VIPPTRSSAYELFYPAAAGYAASVLPASVLAMTGSIALPALAHPQAHAHEMLLGFSLAVVAGNQLGVARGRPVVTLLLLWTAARIAFLVAPASVLSAGLNAAFVGLLAFHIVPRLAGSAKKWRNRALPAVILGLCMAAGYWQIARYASATGVPHSLLLSVVLLFATLMLFMGGRIIAPAVAGQLHRQGRSLQARVQPRLEGVLLACGALAAAAVWIAAATPLAAAAAAVAGLLALVRMGRWRLWALRGRPDLHCLAAGYAWLGAGLVALAAALGAGRYETLAVHLITVGALGTLTLTVMATLWLSHRRLSPARSSLMIWGTALVAASAVCRVLGAVLAAPWLLISAGCWSAAYVLLLLLFWRGRQRPGAPDR
jgi:uncharacterized protein involved in response to NO